MNHSQKINENINSQVWTNNLDNVNDALQYLNSGHQLSQKGHFVEAEAYNRKAIELNPYHPMAYNNLGWTRQMQGSVEEAVSCYREALKLDPNLRIARRNLATLLLRLGRVRESAHVFYNELRSGTEGATWMTGLVTTAMQAPDLTFAGECATLLAGLRCGSTLYSLRKNGTLPPQPVQPPEVSLTISKLRHDIEQFLYLQNKGILAEELASVVKNYQSVIDRLTGLGIKEGAPFDAETRRNIGHIYNRIIYIRNTPRLKKALSDKWDPVSIEKQYLNPPGIVVVDDFLSHEALENIRLFCLESTVWSGNRYAYGRLGAFFHDGFNCPLLLQIAEELRNTLPTIIGDRYPLRQLWGFKNGHYLPGDASTHADFAAVNVNFWITPDEANIDDSCGGLVIYGIDAPSDWDFYTYNGRPDIIKPFLAQQNASSVTIPYKQNRAIIFNSDLFHGTAEIKFRQRYEDRRINITMLYGDRENDIHHQQAAQHTISIDNSNSFLQRSAVFSRIRRNKL